MIVKNPLAEVFGFPLDNQSENAVRHRKFKLCPYNNKVPNCTKDKADNPLGVCSIFNGQNIAITYPVRLRQNWIIVEDAASFFFQENAKWTSLNEVRLNDKNGETAGNIDLVLVEYDDNGKVLDFGALEIQAVYITGNVRKPFEHYINNPKENAELDWRGNKNFPHPDYLSSSRKRLVPQLIYKGGIINTWKKKIAVVLDSGFYETLPKLKETDSTKADIAWLIYDLKLDKNDNKYILKREKCVYTLFDESLNIIIKPSIGNVADFIETLQTKLDEKLENSSKPNNKTIDLDL